MRTCRTIQTLGWVVVVLLQHIGDASAMCLTPLGDITDSGKADATDVQCAILTAITGLADGPPPACLAWAVPVADANCDGTFNVTDVQIVIRYGLSAPLSESVDGDGDGCPDTCASVCLDSSDCDDGDLCTKNICVMGAGCDFVPITCADDDECTDEVCHKTTGCVYLATQCDDSDLCTVDACQPDDGCYYLTANCDDYDPCTFDVCMPEFGCVHEQIPGCDAGPCSVLCFPAGNPGDVVSCPLGVAVADGGVPWVAAMQFLMKFDSTRIKFINFFDEYCFAGLGCFDVAVSGTGATVLQPSGHSVAIDPLVAANWPGVGAVAIVNTSNPGSPLTKAYLDQNWNIVGESQFAFAKFELIKVIEPQQSAVCLEEILTADANTFTYAAIMVNGVILSGL